MDVRNCRVAWKSHSAEMASIILKFRYETKYTDATIMCSGYKYPVHKVILASSSKYFEELLQQTENLHPLSHPIIVLNNIKKNGLEAILKFIYLGEVSVQEKDIAQLFNSARELKIKGLSDETLRSALLSNSGQSNLPRTLSTDSATCKESTLESESVDVEKKRKPDTCTGSAMDLRRNPKRHKNSKENDGYSDSAKGSTARDDITTDFEFTTFEATTEDNLGSSISEGGVLTHETETNDNTGEVDEEERDFVDSDDNFVDIKEEFMEESCSSNTETIFLPFKDEPEEVSSANNERDSLGDLEILNHDMISESPSEVCDVTMPLEFESPRTHDDTNPGCSSSAYVQDTSMSSSLRSTTVNENSAIPEELLPDFLKTFKVYKFNYNLAGKIQEKYWEQNGIMRLLEGIKNHEITMKAASSLIGTSYNILYRHYSIIYGGIKKLPKAPQQKPSEAQKKVIPKKFVNVKLLQCPYCQYKSPYQHYFTEHLLTHMKGFAPSHKESVKRDSSTEEDLLTCDICDAKFAHLRTLRSHKQCHF